MGENPRPRKPRKPAKALSAHQAGKVASHKKATYDPDAPADETEPLTPAQMSVLILVAENLSNEEIGQRRNVSPETVAKHIENTYRKLGVKTRAGAAIWANRGAPARECGPEGDARQEVAMDFGRTVPLTPRKAAGFLADASLVGTKASPVAAKASTFVPDASPAVAAGDRSAANPSPFTAKASPFAAKASPFAAKASPFAANASPFCQSADTFPAKPSPFPPKASPFPLNPSPALPASPGTKPTNRKKNQT